jgi:hypothetical protein
MAAAPWVVSDELWGWSSRCCLGGSGVFAIRVASGCPIGRRCRGSCSCCRQESRGGICRWSLASARGRPVTAVWTSGSTRACGSGCTRCCSLGCERRARSSGRGRWPTRARCRRKKGLRDGPEPGGQSESRLQAASPRRRDRHPSRLGADRLQPQRHRTAAPACRCRSGGRRHGRAPAPSTREPDRRPRLRLRPPPQPTASARHRARHRTPPNRPRLRPRPCALGRRTHLCLAAQLQTTARPLRPPRRDPPSLPRAGLLPCLLATTPELIVNRLLSAPRRLWGRRRERLSKERDQLATFGG